MANFLRYHQSGICKKKMGFFLSFSKNFNVLTSVACYINCVLKIGLLSKDLNGHKNLICLLPTVFSIAQSLIPVQRPGRWLSPENPFFLQHFMSAGLKTQALHAGRLSHRLAQSSAPVATGESMLLPPSMFTSFFLQPAKTMLPLSFYQLMVKKNLFCFAS